MKISIYQYTSGFPSFQVEGDEGEGADQVAKAYWEARKTLRDLERREREDAINRQNEG